MVKERIWPLSWLWAVCLVAIAAHQAFTWWHGLPLETDLLALLPRSHQDEVAERMLTALNERATQRVLVMLEAANETEALAAARAFTRALPAAHFTPSGLDGPDNADAAALIETFAPYRANLVAPAPEPASVEQALALLNQPVSGRGTGSVTDDPLQRFNGWLLERARASRIRPVNGVLMVEADGRVDAILQLNAQRSAFSPTGATPLADALDVAALALEKQHPSVKPLFAGVPLLAERAAARASAEVGTVGSGSLLAIIALMLLAFRSPAPIGLVVFSVVSGVFAGLSACLLLFDKVHLVTLIFGASLVGIAEDYGIHYFASRQANPSTSPQALLRHLLPGLALAMLTSVLGYAMLIIAPFPALRQVGVFSSVGMFAAFATVATWLPFFSRKAPAPTRFSTAWAGTRAKWPTLTRTGIVMLSTLAFVCVAAIAVALRADDDIRRLHGLPADALAQQRTVSERLSLPSPAQFFIVEGETEADVLTRTDALATLLTALKERHQGLGGFQAITSWVPPFEQQERNRAAFFAERRRLVAELGTSLDEPLEFPVDNVLLLTVETVLNARTPLATLFAPLWRVDQNRISTGVLLEGLTEDGIKQLLGITIEGVRFVDRTAALSAVFRTWRIAMSWSLLVGLALISAVLFWRYRRRSWRVIVPTVLGAIFAFAALVALNESVTLFHVLALWLLLGMGVDYGIFLLEVPSGDAWLAVGLGAASTVLSFGLLAVSSNPAVHAFGLTLGIGATVIWLLGPMFSDAKGERSG